ncbi:MAG: hypothetical protein HFI75_05290 [Lachnospiraceae bacterium]|nr:hypothetical protein [Lachnospiraceae bacterium]
MNKSFRYWLKNAEDMVVVPMIGAVCITGLQLAVSGEWNVVRLLGLALMIFWADMVLLVNAQGLQVLSLGIILGGTRKNGIYGVHFMNFSALLQIELLQLLLFCLPFFNRKLQLVLLCYTPAVYFTVSGVALLITCLQIRYDKLYKVIYIISCMTAGGTVGFYFSVVALGGQVSMALHGLVLGILFAAGIVLYIAGSLIQAKAIRHMDAMV